MLLLALYEKVTLSRASALPSKQLLPEVHNYNNFITNFYLVIVKFIIFKVLEDLDEVIQESRPLSNEVFYFHKLKDDKLKKFKIMKCHS